ncbi:MAG: hypothetical protein ACOC35_08195 [Promethearchaeia archaeon]
MTYCEDCGTELGKNWKYCHNCGVPIREFNNKRLQSQQTPKESRKHSKEDLLDTLGCIVLIIGVVTLLIIYNFFIEWFEIIIPIVIAIIVLSCIGRIIYAFIGVVVLKLKAKKKKENN